MDRYLDRLPSRQTSETRRARSRNVRMLPFTGVLVLFGLLATTGLATAAITHLVGGIVDNRVSSSTGESCLSASVEPMAASRARGGARLCAANGAVEWALDLEHLAGGAPYAAWLARLDQPEQCRFGALAHYVPGFRQPCPPADLSLPDAQAQLHWLVDTVANASGTAHLDGAVHDAPVPSHTQVWLLVTPASQIYATPAPAAWIARAEFDIP